MKNLRERQVQAAWYDIKLRPRRLLTSCGSEVTVVSPGEWNAGAGPDFRNAVLEIGKAHRRVVGDVEIHLCPADWDFHGHGADANYRNVIAHVTWRGGHSPLSLPKGSVAIFLGHFMSGKSLPSADRLLAYPFARLPVSARPCERKFAGHPELAVKMLAIAGRHRLRMKARRLLGLLCERPDGRRQIFYEETMAALGYFRNSAQFRRLAERVPLSELLAEGERAEHALAAAADFEAFERGGMRPCNSPERRVRNAARLFTASGVMDLVDWVDFSPDACRAAVKTLCGDRFMGRGRAGAVIANVIVPFAIAEGRIDTVPEWLPPEDLSRPVKTAASRLLGPDTGTSGIYADNDLLVQGLIQIHRDFCLRHHPDCEDCGLDFI